MAMDDRKKHLLQLKKVELIDLLVEAQDAAEKAASSPAPQELESSPTPEEIARLIDDLSRANERNEELEDRINGLLDQEPASTPIISTLTPQDAAAYAVLSHLLGRDYSISTSTHYTRNVLILRKEGRNAATYSVTDEGNEGSPSAPFCEMIRRLIANAPDLLEVYEAELLAREG